MESGNGRGEVIKLASAENFGMTSEDLFNQCGARPRHANDKNRCNGGITGAGFCARRFVAKYGLDALEEPKRSLFVIGDLLSLEGIVR